MSCLFAMGFCSCVRTFIILVSPFAVKTHSHLTGDTDLSTCYVCHALCPHFAQALSSVCSFGPCALHVTHQTKYFAPYPEASSICTAELPQNGHRSSPAIRSASANRFSVNSIPFNRPRASQYLEISPFVSLVETPLDKIFFILSFSFINSSISIILSPAPIARAGIVG